MVSLLFQAPPLQRYNRNRFQRGIWKACSMTSSCVRFQFVPTGDPAVLFFFLSDPDMLCLPGCPYLPWPYKNDRAKGKLTPPRSGALQQCLLLGQHFQPIRRCPFPPPGFVSLPKSLFILVRMDSLQAHVNHSGMESSQRGNT